MGNGKKRSFAHIKGESGVAILKEHFPKEWVVREYTPDYGIDMSVELFAPYDTGYITTGEHIFFQVKATDTLEIMNLSVSPRYNVERCQRPVTGTPVDIRVVKYVLDTDLLATVEKMGGAVPVILAVVDRSANNIYCLCLNDYLEKVLIPDEPNYMEQDTKTIYIPIENNLKDMGTSMIEWYGKRAKLYAFFNKIHSQAEDLKYCSAYDLEDEVRHFLSIILRSDVWSACDYFPALKYARGEIDYYVEHGITREAENMIAHSIETGEDVDAEIWEVSYRNSPISFREAQSHMGLLHLWERLENVGDIFEDTIKEYFLPTYLNATWR